jgi:DNA-binding beta-propeller fold protein YncE
VFSVAGNGALTQVSGSPFRTGNGPYSIAFSPDGSLLATADQTISSVSVFTVSGAGALTQVAGSPYASDQTPTALQFSPDGTLLATANDQGDGGSDGNGNPDSSVSVFSVGAVGRRARSRAPPSRLRSRPGS